MSRLLPTGSTPLELAAADACAYIERIPVPIKTLLNPDLCPIECLPYLAWAWSVDRWDSAWSEVIKRDVVKTAMFVHRHKGTIGAIRRVVEPLGYLIRVTEWWQTNDPAGTFRLVIGVQEQGISDEMYQELERVIFDAKPVSRHLIGLSINLDSFSSIYYGITAYDGDEVTVYPYMPTLIQTQSQNYTAAGIHVIDEVNV